jgi:hypothetical protein
LQSLKRLCNVTTLFYITTYLDGELVNATMTDKQASGMAQSRALITETEREHIAGEHGDRRRYEAVSRVRSRINDELTTDIEILEKHHPDLLEELQEVVCEDE